MTKKELQTHVTRYIQTENIIQELKTKYGIDVTNSKFSNFYNEYNYLIHNLLVSIFGDEKVDLIEDYCFGQSTFSFNELCNKLDI